MVGDPFFDHIDHNYYKCHRRCVVPLCPSTTENTPEKLFVQVPAATIAKDEWLRLAGCLPLPSGTHYFCEGHFDIQNDMVNYMEYKVMGHVQRVRLKIGCLPSKFECQEHHKVLPVDNQKSNMFKINVVQGKNVFTIETVPQTDSENAIEEVADKVRKSEDTLNNIKKRFYKKPAIIKVKKCDDVPETVKRRAIIIKPNLKKVKIIKKI